MNRINHEMFLILKFVDVVFVPSLRNISMANRLPPVSEQLMSVVFGGSHVVVVGSTVR